MIQTLLLQAQQAAPAAGAGGPAPMGGCAGGPMQLMPFALIFIVFYFMLIRPQQKKQRELQDWVKSLKKGDEVVTTGGIIGKVSGLTDTVVTLEVQEKVRMKFLRSHIAGKAPGSQGPGPTPEPPQQK